MQNRVGLISGRRGSGKSSTAKAIARYEPRLYVFDPNGEYGDLFNSAMVSNEESFMDFADAVDELNSFAMRWVPAYDPVGDSESFCRLAFEVTKDRGDGATILIDEAHLLFTSAAYTSPELGRVLRLGRHAALNVLLVTPRIAEISRCATFQADWIMVCGAISEPNDLRGLEDRTSADFRRFVGDLGMYGRGLWDAIERRQRQLDEHLLSHLMEPERKLSSIPDSRPAAMDNHLAGAGTEPELYNSEWDEEMESIPQDQSAESDS
jgi:hypothetical protein